jgi:hypothetical protein
MFATLALVLVKFFGLDGDQTADTRACFYYALPSASASTLMGAMDSDTPSRSDSRDFDRHGNEYGTMAELDSSSTSLDILRSSSHERDFV